MSKIVRFKSSHENPFPLEIVGESHYRESFRKIFKRVGKNGVHENLSVHLVFDDNNPYDANAVVIKIGGHKVGHLSRSDALLYRQQLRKLQPGEMIGVCQAYVVGGFQKKDGSKADFGVRLDLDLENLEVETMSQAVSQQTNQPTDKKSSRMLAWIIIGILAFCGCSSFLLILAGGQ